MGYYLDDHIAINYWERYITSALKKTFPYGEIQHLCYTAYNAGLRLYPYKQDPWTYYDISLYTGNSHAYIHWGLFKSTEQHALIVSKDLYRNGFCANDIPEIIRHDLFDIKE